MSTELDRMEDRDLVTHIWSIMQDEARLREERQRAEWELVRRMESRQAQEVHHPNLKCVLEHPTPEYDISKLKRLAEIVPPDVLKTGFTPQHEETVVVPDKWDARVFRSWARKYGTDVAHIVEEAKLPGGPPRLKISPRPKM